MAKVIELSEWAGRVTGGLCKAPPTLAAQWEANEPRGFEKLGMPVGRIVQRLAQRR